MITALCPNPQCRHSLPLEPRFLGRRVTCPHCQQAFQVEVAPAPTADPEGTTTPWLPGADPFAEQPSAPPVGRGPVPPARRVVPLGPPPLPPRPQSTKPGLQTAPTVVSLVSLVSLVVTLGSLIGILLLLRSPTDEGPPAPQPAPTPAAERWAAITIESSGVRLVVIDAKKTPGNPELLLVHATNRDWGLGKLTSDLPARPDKFDELEQILGKYSEGLVLNNVPADHRLVACNEGVITAAGDGGREKLRGWVQESVRKALNREVDFVNAAQEAEYGARGSIPPSTAIRMKSISLDVGGSSTKYGYFDTPTEFRGNKFPIGLRAAEAEIRSVAQSKGLSYPAAAREWSSSADEAIRKLADGAAPLKNHERYYLLGGAPWAVTVFSHPEEFAKPIDARAVDIRLSQVDFERAVQLIGEKPDFPALKAAVLEKVAPGPAREHLEIELTQVGKIKTEHLLAGATLLKSFSDVCNFGGKEVRFYTRSLHAWPVGYILVKGKFEL